MSVSATTTATPTPVAPLSLPSAESLAAALAAVDSASGTSSAAAAALSVIVLARYAFHAERHARAVDGVKVLPDNKRKEVAARLWLDATDSTTPPPAAERTAGETSLGQYLSRYAKVATDAAYGLPMLASVTTVNDAYRIITNESAETKARAAELAFVAWLSGQTEAVQAAFKAVRRALATEEGSGHVAAFKVDLSR